MHFLATARPTITLVDMTVDTANNEVHIQDYEYNEGSINGGPSE